MKRENGTCNKSQNEKERKKERITRDLSFTQLNNNKARD